MIGETGGWAGGGRGDEDRGWRTEDITSVSSSYNKLRIVFQEFGLRVLPVVHRKYQSQSGDQGVEMVSDHRGGDSRPAGGGARS